MESKISLSDPSNEKSVNWPDRLLGFTRDDDEYTRLLRADPDLKLDTFPSQASTASSYAESSSSYASDDGGDKVFTDSCRTSTVPTSRGTAYPVFDNDAKGKAVVERPSSVAATYGSGSETERELIEDIAVMQMGSWAGETQTQTRPKKPRRTTWKKKYPVTVHNGPCSEQVGAASLGSGCGAEQDAGRLYRRDHHLPKYEVDAFRDNSQVLSVRSGSRLNRVTLTLLCFIAVVFLFSAALVDLRSTTGKHSLVGENTILFVATFVLMFFTARLMLRLRRTPLEVFLMLLIEALVVSILAPRLEAPK